MRGVGIETTAAEPAKSGVLQSQVENKTVWGQGGGAYLGGAKEISSGQTCRRGKRGGDQFGIVFNSVDGKRGGGGEKERGEGEEGK